MRNSGNPRLSFILCVATSLWALGASAWADAPQILVRTGQHESYGRLVLDAPQGTNYNIKRDNTQITLSLSTPAQLKIQRWRLERAQNFRIIQGEEGQKNLVVTFNVAPSASLKDFYSESSIVIDISGPLDVPKESPPKEPSPPPSSPQEAPPPPPKQEAALAPTPDPAPLKKVHVGEELPNLKVTRKKPPETRPLSSDEAGRLIKIASENPAKPIAVFDAQVPMGAVAFQRGGYGMILFDRKLAQPFLAPNARVKVEPLSFSQWSGYRIALPEGIVLQVARNGTAWELYLARSNKTHTVSTEFISQPDFALGARLLLSTPEPPTPILFEDPVVGDTLIALPLKEPGAFSLARHLVDFEIIPAVQGLVIKPMHEKVVARIVPDGIEITAEGGLKLSPPQDTGLLGDKLALKHLFHFDRWKGSENESFTETRQKLIQTIVDVPDNEKILARMDLARFYFANAMAQEGLSLLNALAKDIPEIVNQPDFLSLRGACRIMVGAVEEGVKDLRTGDLKDQLESILWQGIADAKLRNWTDATQKFEKTEILLSSYPSPFFSRLQVLAIESALAAQKIDLAEKWLFALEKSQHDEDIDPAIDYMHGVIYAFRNNLKQANELWQKVKKSPDRLYKVRAELALVDLGVATKSLTAKQAVDRLEGLRFSWRGDGLEFDILKRLGNFYIDDHQFEEGLKVLARAVSLFPNSEQVKALKHEMSVVFRKILMTDLGKNLSPLESLALYADFSYLIPKGEKGNEVRFNLAEKLINIDLLDQASDLFEEVLKTAQSDVEKADIAQRLAGVRLLDHRAEDALLVLDASQEAAEKASAQVRLDRQLLRARALSELGRYDEALAALPDSAGQAALLLRAEIAMNAKKWNEAKTTLLGLIGSPPSDGKKIEGDKVDWLVNVALAMAKDGDLEGLDKLATDYGPSMRGSAKADMFHVLTRPEKMTSFKDLAAAQEKLSEIDMFQGFLDTYRKNSAPTK